MPGAYLVTGSSGFIGTHACASARQYIPREATLFGLDSAPSRLNGDHYTHITADIRNAAAIQESPVRTPQSVIHLAAKAEVIFPFEELVDLSSTNVNGTANLLMHLVTPTFVFASSSAVYGTCKNGSRATSNHVTPVGAYGFSKAFGELICADWSREKRAAAIAFRFGNVVGPHCRGLIPFLVRHAVKCRDGSIPAQCRGGGMVLRDYVPVSYIVKLLWSAALRSWKPGTYLAFNAGTGRGMTNGEVAHLVTSVLRQRGYCLSICWDSPLLPGESESIVLNTEDTAEVFAVAEPTHNDVVAAVEEATLLQLSQELARFSPN